jgi:hypothetical protein
MTRIVVLALMCLTLSNCAVVDMYCQSRPHERCGWQK